jgi:hypothetical protein
MMSFCKGLFKYFIFLLQVLRSCARYAYIASFSIFWEEVSAMSILKTATIYAVVAAVGWGAHSIYESVRENNAQYTLGFVNDVQVITKKDENLTLPVGLLFENYKLTTFVKKELDGLDKQYLEFKKQYAAQPQNKTPIKESIERLLLE